MEDVQTFPADTTATESGTAAEPETEAEQPNETTAPSAQSAESTGPAAEGTTYTMTLAPDQYDALAQKFTDLKEIEVIFFNILLGVIMGYLAVKGMTSAWKS